MPSIWFGMDLIHLKQSFKSLLFLSFQNFNFAKGQEMLKKTLILILLHELKRTVNKEQNVFLNNYLRMKMFEIFKCYQELSSLL